MQPAIKLLSLIEATTVTGPAKNLLDFCRLTRSPELQEAGFPLVDVSIVTFHRSPEQASANGREIEEEQSSPNSFVTAARAAGVNVDVITERFRFDPNSISQLRRLVALRTPDIIQTHMVKSHFLTKLSGLGKRYPWVAYHHGYTTTDLKMRAYNQLNRWSLPSANKVITVCGAFARDLAREGVKSERIVVCHNSVVAPRQETDDERRALKSNLKIEEEKKIILAVGRLSAEKGHADLVDALARLVDLNSSLDVQLLIVGEGPEDERLMTAVQQKGLNQHVVFIGHVHDVAPFYAIADAVALPSHSEGSPNVLLEAMAKGIPVVATSVGGVPEIATDSETALLVPSRNPERMAIALERVLIDESLARKLGENARAHVLTHFSPEIHAESLVRIHEQVLADLSETSKAMPSSV